MSPRLIVILLAILGTAVSSGCLRRRMTVRTSPPGAMVYVDHQPIGMSPVSTRFTYYGTRHFEIVKDGYRTEKFLRRINPPWYELPGLAFVTETLWPFETRDERVVDVELSPAPVVPTEAIIASGQELRDQALLGVAVSNTPSYEPRAEVPVVPTLPSSPSPSDVLPPAAEPSSGSFFDLPRPLSVPATEITPGGSFRPTVE